MFINDLNTCMLGNTALNTMATGGILYDSAPIGADRSKNWIVYDFDRISSDDLIGHKDDTVYYDIEVQIISPSLVSINNIANALKTYFQPYDDGKIRNIAIVEENDVDQDDETGLYFKTNLYNITYEPNE